LQRYPVVGYHDFMLEFPLSVDSYSKFNTTTNHAECVRDWGRITERIAAGDQSAFAVYYERFFDEMFSEVKRVSNLDEASCLDIVQDSMIKVIRNVKKVDTEPMLAAWSRAVARNTAYDWLRKLRKKSSCDLDGVELPEKSNPEFFLEQEARLIWIEQQILQQPPEIQHLFSLRYRMGWTLQRIAKYLGLKTGAVDGKLRRAIKKIKEMAEASIE